ncbi:MAG TPA: ATP-binding protein, partial [Candidatus Thermoplasmatota archaeon]|nr:ATP-binding protein [Candidatus Thermoplasmatota archaeon]
RTMAALRRAFDTGRETTLDFDFPSPDGTRYFQSRIVPELRPDGPPLHVTAVTRDVTEERRTRAALQAAERQLSRQEKLSALGTLVAGVAHEIRTPLTYLRMNSEVLRRRAASHPSPDVRAWAEEHADLFRDIDGGVERIGRLVNELRRVNRLTESAPARGSIDGAVADALRLFAATSRSEAMLDLRLAPTPEVHFHPTQVQQVVLNLVQNAAEAMHGRPGRIHVETRAAPDGGAQLVVEDEGPGIPPDIEPHLFQPLFTTKVNGTGLGLSIVKTIIDRHGGRVRVERGALGGARFVVDIPRADAARAEQAQVAREPTA